MNFSNHAGYGRSGGSKTTAAELNAIFESMEQNELLLPARLLTGYIPGAEALSAVERLASKLKHARPSLIYLLDPVMGDAGRLYVAADVIPVYREMLPLATIITPNWFEVEILTGVQLNDFASLRKALSILHLQYHVPNAVISSIPLKQWLVDALPPLIRPPHGDHLLCITSSVTDAPLSSSAPSLVHAQWVPTIPGYFSDVRDLFSALLLATSTPTPLPPHLKYQVQTALSEAAAREYLFTRIEWNGRLPSSTSSGLLSPLAPIRLTILHIPASLLALACRAHLAHLVVGDPQDRG